MIWAPTLLAKSIGDCAHHPSFFSDHRYMLLTFSTGDIFERSPGVWKFNTSLLEEANYLSLVRSFWSFWKTQETSLLFSSPLDWWDQGKDRLETKNYRPISLLNVDYKIATRAISGRLLGVIGSIVGYDQTCGIPGRTISEIKRRL
jgi:hypothetical protein